MKKFVLGIVLSLVVIGLGNLSTAAPSGFVYREGTNFYLNGQPYYFAGCNSYDLFTYGDGSNDSTTNYIENYFMNKAGIDTIMSNMAADGVKVVRTWGFSHETWHGFEPVEGQYNEAQFMLFDYIMEAAKANGIKVLIVLENYWEAYGGIDDRLKWEGLSGESHANRARFFTNEGCKEQYRNYVKHFVTRVNHYTDIPYIDDPTIFAWELMNEPRYQDAGENSTGTTLRAWVDEMAAYIKELDSNHMVSVGIEGHESKYGFGGDEGNPFVYIHQSPYIDFCTAHPYPDESWANLTVDQTRTLIEAWISDAHNVVGKPFVLEEWNVHNNKDQYWTAILEEIEEHDAGGSLFWNYNDYRTSNFDMLQGDAILAAIFRPHSERMAAKSGTVVSASPTVTTTVTATATSTVTATATPTATVTATATATNTAGTTPTADNCTVTYTQFDWGSGATVSVTVKNNGSSAINGWELAFSFPGNQKITNVWCGVYTQSGVAVTIGNTSYNSTIAAGGTVSFGFNISYSGTNDRPAAFTLNGTACEVR
ncbi:MAG: cellulose binding domain-containing protein [Bacillota bacterium]